MRDKLKGLVLGIIIGTILTGGTVLAASTTKIDVLYENLKYIVDGVEKKPTTGQGFIYQGTTYVPLRFAGEALGKDVTWDGKTKTITIGKKENAFKYLSQLEYARVEGDYYETYFYHNSESYLTIAGDKYHNGIGVLSNRYESGVTNIKYNLNGKYKKLTGFIGIEDSAKNLEGTENSITIVGDGEVLYRSPDLVGGDMPREISVDISGVLRLEVQFYDADNSYGRNFMAFTEVKLFQ